MGFGGCPVFAFHANWQVDLPIARLSAMAYAGCLEWSFEFRLGWGKVQRLQLPVLRPGWPRSRRSLSMTRCRPGCWVGRLVSAWMHGGVQLETLGFHVQVHKGSNSPGRTLSACRVALTPRCRSLWWLPPMLVPFQVVLRVALVRLSVALVVAPSRLLGLLQAR